MAIELTKVARRGRSKSTPDGLLLAAQQLREEYDLRLEVQKPRLQMQDFWLLCYLLVDQRQAQQPANRSKFFSPRLQSIADTARRVLAANPVRYHSMTQFLEYTREEREPIRTLENVLHGMLYDIDRQLTSRGEMNSRNQAAFHAVVRGQWAYKLHLSRKFKSSTNSPVHYQQLDPRQVLGIPDMSGVDSVVVFDTTTLGQLYHQHKSLVGPVIEKIQHAAGGPDRVVDYSFLHRPLLILEWSSREEHAVLVDLSGLPDEIADGLSIKKSEHSSERYLWITEPFNHGFQRSLVQFGNANGVPAGLASQEAVSQFNAYSALNRMPVYAGGAATEERLATPIIYLPDGATVKVGHTVDTAGALQGRSIYAGIAHLIPEFNEMMSMLKDAVAHEIRGTWTLKSRDGRMLTLDIGTGKVNPMRLDESLDKIDPHIQTPDVATVLQLLNQEISDGSLDLRFILASDAQGSGYLRARIEQGALTQIADYRLALENWATSLGDSFVQQFRAAGGKFSDWKIRGRSPGVSTSYFVIDVDDKVQEAMTGAEPPVFEAKVKVAMPIDLMARINMAKAAIDPSNPIMSLIEALDLIMETDDAEGAYDSIIEDIGNRNPTIQLAKIAAAFRRKGAPELADMIMQDSFRGAFTNATQQGATITGSGAPKGTLPSTAPPEITSGGGTEVPRSAR